MNLDSEKLIIFAKSVTMNEWMPWDKRKSVIESPTP